MAKSIGSFEILTKLSSGGMGDVLLARRRGAHGFEKLLAIKTIRGGLAKRPEIRAMFLDEARLVARIDHPRIAQVYDFGEEDGALFLAMEYVPGIPLNKLIAKRGRPLPPLVAARIAAEVLRGLHAAHELSDLDGVSLGVVHRDVTHGNLLLTFDGEMKIVDFGIAFMKARESPDTQLGELKGKPSYMPPEQIRGEGVDRRSDVYSLSVVLHELVTGRKLFTRENVVATVLAVERDEVPTPSSVVGALPEGFDAIVMKGLARDPNARFQDAREMARALDEVCIAHSGESLEAFVDRELVAEQAAHRAWLHAVLAGNPPEEALDEVLERVPSHVGRSNAPDLAEAREIRARDPATHVHSLSESTTLVPQSVSADVPVSARRSKRRWLPIGIALAIIVALFAHRFAATSSNPDDEEASTAIPIAPIVAEPPGSPSPAPDELPPETTRAPDDALRTPVPVRQDSPKRSEPRPTRDEDPRKTNIEPSPTPTTFGQLTVGSTPYALVRIDGRDVGVTPIMGKRLPTGRVTIELVAPDTGEVRLHRVVELREGEHEHITYP